jgi:hypothetical protein
MEFEQQQFKDFFSSPEKIGAGVQEKECSITMPAAVESLAALCQRWWLWWQACGSAISELPLNRG